MDGRCTDPDRMVRMQADKAKPVERKSPPPPFSYRLPLLDFQYRPVPIGRGRS